VLGDFVRFSLNAFIFAVDYGVLPDEEKALI
jgi:hypothetical protein